MADLQRESPLFDHVLPIQVQDGVHDTRHTNLVFRILQGTQATPVVGQTEKVFHLEITDERDSYFLYYMDVGEADFHQLKRDQSILVEFNVFPLKLIELIELCLYGPTDPSPTGDHSSSTYIAKLDTVSCVFSVVEANKFKQLTHISLVLRQGDDLAIKMYLASRLAQTLEVAQRQALSIDSLGGKLAAELQKNADMSAELYSLQTKSGVDAQSSRSLHSQEMSAAQMLAMETIEGMRVKFETQLDAVRAQLDKTQREMQDKSTAYEQHAADLTFEKGQVEFKLRDTERNLSSTVSDRDRLLSEWKSVTQERREMEAARTLAQGEIVKLESRVDTLTQQLLSKNEQLENTVAMHRASEDARSNVEQRLLLYVNNAEVLQENLHTGAGEIERGNAIISKLNEEARQAREKIRTKSEVIRRQEVVVKDLRLRLLDTEHLLAASREVEKKDALRIASLEQQLAETLDRLQESNGVIASNQEVISYLNEEVNKWQLGMRVGETTGVSSSHAVTPLYKPLSGGTGGTGGSASPDAATAVSSYRYPPTSSYVVGDKSTPGAGGAGGDLDDVYRRGIQNLGLENVGVDWLKTLDSSALGTTSKLSGGTGDLDLEGMDYYSLSASGSNTKQNVHSGSSPPHKSHIPVRGPVTQQYAWQSPDFGLVDSNY
ncbi:hypothetical protein B484DRAFT_262960 [Ochromonadaceae sp. CCMP2298]|nr:hypothetical protein B484DRAFT_262960 [Ochromonadaceae sp. CCMP2298]|mmetsp:Transcript_2895/g.6116  ORF Transcript_2895/g.6116 Transcript_2895/m.6116 type:complete len:661 (-) Transcript_2895:272-2254(-)